MLCSGESIWKFHYMELIRGIWNEVKPGLLLILPGPLLIYLFYYSTDDMLLRKALTDILNCCDIHFTYILLHMANLLNRLFTSSQGYCNK